MNKKNTLLTLVLCGALLLSACDKNDNPDEIVVSDDLPYGNGFPAASCGVNLQKPVERAVSLSPALTEIICELGFNNALVGISTYCDFPDGLSCDKVGSSENPDIDAIVELAPDAVFTFSALSERDVYTLNQAGISVLVPNAPQNMEDYSVLYREISAAFYGRTITESELEVEQAVQIGKDARLALENSAKSVRMESFLYVTAKMTIAGDNTFENAVLSLSGDNLCTESGYITAEDYEGESPKFLIVDSTLTLDSLEDNYSIYKLIDDDTEIRFVDSVRFERPTARTAEIFREIADELTPD